MASPITIQELREQIVQAPMKLTPFAQSHKWQMDQFYLCENPSPTAFDYVRQHYTLKMEKYPVGTGILYDMLARNPAAIAYIERNTHGDGDGDGTDYLRNTLLSNSKLTANVLAMMLPITNITENNFYSLLSGNPSNAAVDYMIDHHPNKICWSAFSKNTNPRAVAFLRKNPTKINWSCLSGNTSNEAVRLLQAHSDSDLIDLDELSKNSNPHAFQLLLANAENTDQINYSNLAANTNPKALAYLFKHANTEQNPFGLNWFALSTNPAAIKYLEANPEKVVFPVFWKNPAIFEKDYQAFTKSHMSQLAEEIMMVALHPDRIDRWVQMGVALEEIVDSF